MPPVTVKSTTSVKGVASRSGRAESVLTSNESCDETWAGYNEWRCVATTPKAGTEIWRQDILKDLKRTKASCLWKAIVHSVQFKEVASLKESLKAQDLTLPTDVEQALSFVPPSVGVYSHNPFTGVVDCFKPPEKNGWSVLHVLTTGKGLYAPHWLPVVRVKDKAVWVLPKETKEHIASGMKVTLEDERYGMLFPEEALERALGLKFEKYQATVKQQCQDFEQRKMVYTNFASGTAEMEVVRLMYSLELQHMQAVEDEYQVQKWVVIKEGWGKHEMAACICAINVALKQRDSDVAKRLEKTPAVSLVYGKSTPPLIAGATAPWWIGGDEGEMSNSIESTSSGFFSRWWHKFERFVLTRSCADMYEMRNTVLEEAKVSPGDYFYSRTRPAHPIDPYLYDDGSLNPQLVDCMVCEGCNLGLEKVADTTVALRDYRVYKVVLREATTMRRLKFKFFRRPTKITRVAKKDIPVVELKYSELKSLPTDTARVRAMYQIVKPLLPEEVVGPLMDVRNEHMALDNKMSCDVVRVAGEMSRLTEAVRKTKAGSTPFRLK